MQIVVLLKQILDPEIPPRDFRIDAGSNRPVQGGAKLVLDSYAENALETAIQLRDSTPGARVTAITLGDQPTEEVLRRAFAFTADAAVRVWDPAWKELDGQAVGYVLARAIASMGGADLILAGRQSGDMEEGLVGPTLAEELGVTCATLVSHLQVEGNRVRVTREADGGYAVLELPLPAVLTVTSSEVNVPRLPKVKDAMMAKSKPIKLLGAAEIAADLERLQPGTRLERAYVPVTDVACEILGGGDGPEKANSLAGRLVELKVL